MNRDTSATARIARMRQKIQGQESDGGVQTDYSQWLQKRLGRTIFFNQTLNGVTTDVPCACVTSSSANNIFATGFFSGTTTFYNSDESSGATLTTTGNDAFIVKYNSSGNVTWATKIGGSSNDRGFGISIDSENNVLATGYFQGTATFYNSDGLSGVTLTATGTDAFIVKYNSSGTVTWATKIGGFSNPGASIAIDSENNVLVTGYFSGTTTFYNSNGLSGATLTATGTDAFIVKYNSSGTVTWDTQISSTEGAGTGIAIDSENNVLVTGYFDGTATFYNSNGSSGETLTGTGYDAFIVKYNSSGNVTWATKITGSSNAGTGIAIDSENNVLATGNFSGTTTFYNSDGSLGPILTATVFDAFVVKYDSSGTVTWAIQIGGTSSQAGNGIAIDSENNVLATGYFSGAAIFYNSNGSIGETLTATGTDAFIAKYNLSGDVTWATKIGGSSQDVGTGIAIDSENSVLATGYFSGTTTFYNSDGSSGASLTATGNDAFIVKYDSSGTVTWDTQIGGSSTDRGLGIAVR